MNYTNINCKKKSGICYITINRPRELNALNTKTIAELNNAIKLADSDPVIRTIILTGSGTKAFVAGADIKEFVSFDKSSGEDFARKGQDLVFDLLERIGTPTIAAINGYALGGGLELAMACHIRIASDNAKMGLPEVSLGVIPGYGGTQRMSKLVGRGRAIEMIVTGEIFSSTEAKKWGLINHVCAQEDLITKAENIAYKISKNSPMAISKAIKSINAGYSNGFEGYEVEKIEFGSCFGTPEFIEGTSAFLEKRKPNF